MCASDPYLPIKQWAKTPTWNTTHPLDIKRFNRAIGDVYATLGNKTSVEVIIATIEEFAANTVWPITSEERTKTIDSLAKRASAIIDYLNDTSS